MLEQIIPSSFKLKTTELSSSLSMNIKKHMQNIHNSIKFHQFTLEQKKVEKKSQDTSLRT